MLKISYYSILFCVMFFGCARTTVQKESIIKDENDKGSFITKTTINHQDIEILKKEWEKEFIFATGQAPVVKKYPEVERNRMLARRGAILDAQRNLAEKIFKVNLSSTSTMSDYVATDYIKSYVNAELQDLEILMERYIEADNLYEVQIQMPKLVILKIIEEFQTK